MKRFAFAAAAALLFSLTTPASSAGEEIMLPNGLADAKVGDWALYRIPDGYTQKINVVKREGQGPEAEVTVRVESILDGKVVEVVESVLEAGEKMEPLAAPDDNDLQLKLAPETIKVNGKELKGYSVTVTRGDAWVHTWYISPSVAVYGLIKRNTQDGKGDFELLDFHKN